MQRTEPMMGTVLTVRVEDDIYRRAVDEVFEMWANIEVRFSTFRPTSQISRIGRGELGLDDADPDVRQVLTECEQFHEMTGGRFSIRPGRSDGPGIDPAGYVKGWSVDTAALMLMVAGANDFVICAGGDVLCSGAPRDEAAWRVGIRHPETTGALGAIVSMNRGGVATSGEYERGGHIWGPRVTEASLLSVSVVGPSLGVADALATALFADQAASLDWMSAYPDYGIIMFDAGGTVRWSASVADSVEVPALSSVAAGVTGRNQNAPVSSQPVPGPPSVRTRV